MFGEREGVIFPHREERNMALDVVLKNTNPARKGEEKKRISCPVDTLSCVRERKGERFCCNFAIERREDKE